MQKNTVFNLYDSDMCKLFNIKLSVNNAVIFLLILL